MEPILHMDVVEKNAAPLRFSNRLSLSLSHSSQGNKNLSLSQSIPLSTSTSSNTQGEKSSTGDNQKGKEAEGSRIEEEKEVGSGPSSGVALPEYREGPDHEPYASLLYHPSFSPAISLLLGAGDNALGLTLEEVSRQLQCAGLNEEDTPEVRQYKIKECPS